MNIFAALALLAVLIGGPSSQARAHELRPSVFTMVVTPDHRYEIAAQINLEAVVAGIGSAHQDSNDAPQAAKYNELRSLAPDDLEKRFRAFLPSWLGGFSLIFDEARAMPRLTFVGIAASDDLTLARISMVQISGEIPAGAAMLRWSTSPGFGNSIFRVKRPGDTEMTTSWVNEGGASEVIPLTGLLEKKNTLALLGDYIVVGFTHIVPKGLDHILFVLGLYLLSTNWKPLLAQVTAFTIAHSITLALGVYGVVRLSPAIVEPLIALSIVYVAFENMATAKLSPWRPFVVFGFGLLHGLGFASVLEEIGLPRSDFITGLAGFNLGVEFGQLAVIAAAWLVVGVWFGGKPWYRRRVILPGSAAIAITALYWTVERIFFA